MQTHVWAARSVHMRALSARVPAPGQPSNTPAEVHVGNILTVSSKQRLAKDSRVWMKKTKEFYENLLSVWNL